MACGGKTDHDMVACSGKTDHDMVACGGEVVRLIMIWWHVVVRW